MATPVITVTLGGTDISDDSISARWGRGANFDGTSESPGFATIEVKNDDRRFSPYNASSPIASVLKIGKLLRVTCVMSSVTYYMFEGYLRRVVEDDKTASLFAEDALWRYSRLTASVAASSGRTLTDFRTAILDDIGATATRTLGTGTAEQMTPVTGADQQNARALLTGINAAAGSIHFIQAISGGHRYKVITRLEMQTNASVETISDTDFAEPFPESLRGSAYTDEGVINRMHVQAKPRLLDNLSSVVWESSEAPFSMAASATRTLWANFSDPTFSPSLSYASTGTPTVTPTFFSSSAKLVIAGGATGAQFSSLTIRGTAAPVRDLQSHVVEDATSQTDYGVLNDSMSSELISSASQAEGLASWYIYRYKQPKARPSMTAVNRWTTQLNREVGDRITLTAGRIGVTAQPFWIRSFVTTVKVAGAIWVTDYNLEAAPATLTLFTVGGTAAQGLGGANILGY